MPVHEEAVDVERAIVDAEVAACTVKRFSNGQDRRITEQGFSTEALHRAAVKVIAAQVDVGMVARAGCSCSLYSIAAGRVAFQIEAIRYASINIFEVRVRREPGRRRDKIAAVGRLVEAAGVLINEGDGVMVSAILVASTELYSVHCVSHRQLIVDVLRREGGIYVAEIGLVEDIVAADIDVASLAEGKIQFKTSRAQAERVLLHLEETANIHEFQIAIAQAAGCIVATDVQVGIHPERDITAKVTGGEYAEKAAAEIRLGNERCDRARRNERVKLSTIAAGLLEESIHPQADRGHARNCARPYGLREELFLGRRSQQDRRYLKKPLIIGRELEAGIFKGLAKIIQLGKVGVAGRT